MLQPFFFSRSFLVLMLLVSFYKLPAAEIPAASCSQADVQAALNAATTGDTIRVPAGTGTWSGLAINKAVHLQGAGTGQTRITVSGNTVTKQVAGIIRVTDFTFTKSGGGNSSKGFYLGGSWKGTEPILFKNNEFTISGTGLFRISVAGGVIFSGNSFSGGWDDSFIQFSGAVETENSWGTADSMGTRDATGKLNIYVEDNTFYGAANQGIDVDFGGRIVYRYNSLTYSSFNTHGFATSQSGVRHFEIYNNSFNHDGGTSQLANQNWAIWIRGGTGVIFNNQIDDLAGPYWGDKAEIKLTIRGAEDAPPPGSTPPVPYPVPRQLGQGHNGTKYVTDPLYIWNNSGTAVVGAGWNWGNPHGLNFATYFQWGRDGFKDGTAKPGYTPYTYPHPLVNGGSNPPPPPPPPPTDTSAPNVSWTAPSNGSSVSGNVTLSVNASDNIGVEGVQFKSNGLNLGSEDASAPYSATWNTNALNNGSYVLTATARDAAGNSTSVDLTVTVSSPTGGNTFYVDQSAGNDSNPGTQAHPWKNAPGMNGSAAHTGGHALAPGDTVYFDRDDTWTVTGSPQGFYLMGGVRYIGDVWEADSGTSGTRAQIRAGNDFNNNGVVRFRDHATLETLFKGFEVNVNGMSANGIDLNHGFWSLMNGANKRVENVEVHHVFTEQSKGEYKYGIAMSNFGGANGILENVEILKCSVHDIGRDAIVLYPSDDPDSRIGNILVSGCEVYHTGQDPTYSEGHGIVVKGWVYQATLENNYIHNVNSSAVFVSGPENNGTQRGADNLHIRNNILTTQDNNGIIRLYKKGAKDVKVYGNILFDNDQTGGLNLGNNSGTLDLLVYNNTFYNTFVDLGSHASNVNSFEFKNNIVQYASNQLRNAGAIQSQSHNLLVSSNPGFTNPNNKPSGFLGSPGTDLRPNADGFSLTSTSSAVDAGTALASAYAGSINSLSRPQGSAWDIGAYERSAAPSNQPPTANAQSVSVAENASLTITLSGTDPDSGPAALRYSVVAPPTHGTLSGSGTHRTYTPHTNFNGNDSFTFKVNDGASDSSAAQVSIAVIALPPPNSDPVLDSGPTATPASSEIGEAVAFQASATDADNDTLTYTWDFKDGTSGSGMNPPHTFSAAGTYAVTVTVTDGRGGSTQGTVTVVVTDSISPQLAVTSTILKGSVSDAGGTLSLKVAGEAVTVKPDGSWEKEVTLESGSTTISVEATDEAGNRTSRSISIVK